MIHLVTGGASSGKSAYAEALLSGDPAQKKYYIATMKVEGAEDMRRVERHLVMRDGKGFCTLECPHHLAQLEVSPGSAVLVECITTLVANELFLPEGAGRDTAQAVLDGVLHLQEQATVVILVTGDVFADGGNYDTGTQAYLEILGEVNCRLAAAADTVTEVICGIPLIHKEVLHESSC